MQKPTHYSETIASTKWTQVIKATGMNGKKYFWRLDSEKEHVFDFIIQPPTHESLYTF